MSQPYLQPQLPPPAVPNEVKEEEVPVHSSTEPQPPQVQVSQPEHLQEPPPKINTCNLEHCMYKNKLQEHTQKASRSLPVYTTVNEGGPQHMPMFRSTVLVDGVYYTSSFTFQSRKAAEQDVAKVALDAISDKIENEDCPLLHEDTRFCKSALNDYIVKMNLSKPTYTTTKADGTTVPVFVSSLVFDGTPYSGPAGKNKKEAEQLVARTVIQSILENSESSKVMVDILRSKTRLLNAMNKAKDQVGVQIGSVPSAASHLGDDALQTVGVPPAEGENVNIPGLAIPVSGAGTQTGYPVPQPFHEFRKRKAESPLENDEVTPPIAFVPPVMGESPLVPGKKKNRKKKKAKKAVEPNNQLEIAAIPLCQLPPCSVAQ